MVLKELLEKLMGIIFPYKTLRKGQREFIRDVCEWVTETPLDESGHLIEDQSENDVNWPKNMLAHVPTGIGKTLVLAPLLAEAKRKKLTLIFLTSRLTHHRNAIELLKESVGLNPHLADLKVADVIGKKWMCAQPVANISGRSFHEHCKALRDEGNCEFYKNTYNIKEETYTEYKVSLRYTATVQPTLSRKKKILTEQAKQAVKRLEQQGISHAKEVVESLRREDLCPYEIVSHYSKKADVVIADYSYVFHPTISESFFRRLGRKMEETIIVVDEGHNLASRLRDMMTTQLSTFAVRNAVKEAKQHKSDHVIPYLTAVQDALNFLSESLNVGGEKLVEKKDLIQAFGTPSEYQMATEVLGRTAERILKEQKRSHISSVVKFLVEWQGPDDGFARILSMQEFRGTPYALIKYRFLDPSLLSGSVMSKAHKTLVMSGTLKPLYLYRDLLGMGADAKMEDYDCPFPKENRLALIVTSATTAYKERSEQGFKVIAEICAGIANRVPGNSAIFFPSYFLRDQVQRHMDQLCEKTTFLEAQKMTLTEREEMLSRFGEYQNSGAVLLGVISGSFAEGVDYPGDLLKTVVIVGVPFQRLDLETKCLINYYDKKFRGNGNEYGYVHPTMTRALQSAGRCIRTHTDRGGIIFLDRRYAESRYRKYLPFEDWRIKLCESKECYSQIENFFKEDIQSLPSTKQDDKDKTKGNASATGVAVRRHTPSSIKVQCPECGDILYIEGTQAQTVWESLDQDIVTECDNCGKEFNINDQISADIYLSQ